MWAVRNLKFVLPVGASAALLWAPPAAAGPGSDLARDDLATASLLLAVAGWLVFLGTRERWGREPGRRDRDDEAAAVASLDDSPAVVQALRHDGDVGASVVGAIVLDLARRGHLTIVEERRDGFDGGEREWRFRRRGTALGDLRPYENAVYTRLFATGDEITQSELAAWARANRQQARVFLERIQRYVTAELDRKGYVERGRRAPVIINLVATGVVALCGVAALAVGAIVGLVAVISAAGQVALTRTLQRRTAVGADQSRRWGVLTETLRHIGEAEEVPVDDVSGWEWCLVYAATLGVAGEFLDGLGEHDEDLVRDDEFASWYETTHFQGPRLGAIGDLPRVLGAALSDAIEPSRSPRLVGRPG